VAASEPSRLYDAYYFAHGCGEPYQRSEVWLALFNSFSERIVRDINPSSVLDAGCAMGFLVETLRQRGIEAWGVDISEYAISQVTPEMRDFCWRGSVTEPFPRRYDLIVSIEVLEHLTPQQAEQAVENFCRHSDDILFSSTPYDYKEASHFNVQPPEYWAELFARHQFFRDVDFDASFITPWTVRFRRKAEPLHRLVRDYERRFWQLWKENTDLRALSLEMRDQLSAGEQASNQLQERVQLLENQLEATNARPPESLIGRVWRRLQRSINRHPESRS
jgi:SAM-dependent methyltransferase